MLERDGCSVGWVVMDRGRGREGGWRTGFSDFLGGLGRCERGEIDEIFRGCW